ncbi:MAG: DegQ family serine endoprotease [Rhodobacteraceae bacterium]|uniref:DegQ family serine endoprotease n=1 Tax=Accumulibacter sp. TaxID=2053492 RepID=UPI0019FA9995|nr:DegQ family serine endoprotease [Accumulibacter sp.]MBE2258596.1 DegQ family serine endoprotease [Paracoccaceae bacterium]
MQATTFKRSLLAVTLIAAVGAGYAKLGGEVINSADAVAALGEAAAPAAGVTARNGVGLPDFTGIVAHSGPAVVNISATGTSKTAFSGGERGQRGQQIPDFFRHFGIPSPDEGAPSRGMGSGFIVRADGVILTNAHVVSGADEVTVKLTDKREFKAKVVGLDKVTDVAVLRIDATNLPVVRLGNPGSAQVGEWVVAIGSPFGFENTVTAGIVSAKGRSLASDSYVPFIQTDVAVNPGNSGGPLINLNGEVIGINSQIYSRNGGYQGVSFAIPIDVAMNIEQQLLQHGKVSHGRMGVTIQEVSQSLAQSFGLKTATGALISSVEKGSPAATAGLEPGDVILKLNDREITRSSELPPLVAAIKPGTRISVQIWRKGATREIALAVGEIPTAAVAANGAGESDNPRLGLALRPLTPEERGQSGGQGGLVVENVSGPAARAGIQRGDVVLSLNGQPVGDVAQLRALLDKSGKTVALLIERDDAKIFVPVDIG